MIDFFDVLWLTRMMDNNDKDDVLATVPVLDEHDAAAVAALLIRVARIDEEMTRDKELVAAANQRIAANTAARSKTVTAFGVFGFDLGLGLWKRVRHSLGNEAYDRALAIAKGQEIPDLLKKMTAAGADNHGGVNNEAGPIHHTPRVKDAILEYLRGAGDSGATARAVREHLADVHHLSVHEKTPGMTLYRLLKEGLVTRKGRTWYANVTVRNNENEPSEGDPKDDSETR